MAQAVCGTSELFCKAARPRGSPMLAGFKQNVSHQEIERILAEIEAWYGAASEQAGVEWLPIEGIQNFLCQDLGYEDMDEFEDAIQGSFTDFCAAFPHIEVRFHTEE